MFGSWYIAIGFLLLLVLGIVGYIVFNAKYKMYHKLYWNTHFDYEKRKMYSDKEYTYEELTGASVGVLVAGAIFGVIFTLVAILVPIECKKEVAYFKQQSEYVARTIENGTDLENIAISQTVIEQNEWLAKSKADLEIYGCWSGYYGSDLEELTPIVIER